MVPEIILTVIAAVILFKVPQMRRLIEDPNETAQ